ncbi:MAG: hypothetical protein AB7L84_09415 [Acidimicrobiia bacterium]
MDEEIIQQMGLLLTQVRVARMSLEHIERSTSRFAGLALQATTGGIDRPAFGAPPLIDGALKVYVVNIGDLVEAAPGGGFLETLMGGVGRFVGGLVGGIAGGVVGGVAVPYTVDRLASLVESVERITTRLLTTLGLSQSEWRALLGLNAEGTGRLPPRPAEPPGPISIGVGELIGRMAPAQVVTIVEALTRVVDALVLLVPLAVGAVASLLSTLGDLRLQIVEWIGFALRMFLLLRAVAVAVLADTASLVAPIATAVLGAVARMADVVLAGLGALLASAVTGAMTTVRILAGGLASAINAAVSFITGTILPLLNYFQGTPLVRLVAWFATALPSMLVALAAAAGRPVSSTAEAQLNARSREGLAVLGAAGPPIPVPTTLSAGDIIAALGPTAERDLQDELARLGGTARRATGESLDAATAVITDTAGALRTAARRSTTTLGGVLEEQLGAARGHIAALDRVMTSAEGVAARRPEATTIDRIAGSYREWLTGGGLQQLLGAISRHFATTPAEGEPGRTVPGRVLQGFVDAEGRHDVIVEVGEVVIELGAPATPSTAALDGGGAGPDAALARLTHIASRGGTIDDVLPVAPESLAVGAS